MNNVDRSVRDGLFNWDNGMGFLLAILNFLLRWWPFRRHVQVERVLKAHHPGSSRTSRQDLLVWLPVVGWIVVVQDPQHDSIWLRFLVAEVNNNPDVGLRRGRRFVSGSPIAVL